MSLYCLLKSISRDWFKMWLNCNSLMTILLCNPALSYWLAVICNGLKFSMMRLTDYLRECQKVVSVRGLVLVEPKVEVKSDGLADTE